MNKAARTLTSGAIMRSLLALCLLALAASACKSTDKPDSAQFASVEIRGHSAQEIRGTTAIVFQEQGYKASSGNYSTLVFERPGSTMNNLAYGNWMGGGIATRVKLNIVNVTGDLFRIDAHAFLVRNKGEVLEEEVTISKMHRKPYQKMMDEIGKRLGQPPPK